jgi:hypothetical protein
VFADKIEDIGKESDGWEEDEARTAGQDTVLSLAMNANAAVFAFQFQNLAFEDAACALAFDRPNLSVFAADGAVINGVKGLWRPGDPPKNWDEIRRSFWGPRYGAEGEVFLLGDFASFCRFCALSHSSDLAKSPQKLNETEDDGSGAVEE